MWRLVYFGYAKSPFVIGLTLLLTFLLAWKGTEVRIDVSTDALTAKESPLRDTYERVRENFGSDQIASIYASDPNLFTYDRLSKLQELNRFLQGLPYVESVGSLFTLPDIRHLDGVLETSPLLRRIPATEEELQLKKQQAIENPLLRRNVVSEDGNSTLLTVYLSPDRGESLSERDIYEQFESILARYQNDFTELYQVGGPALQTWMMDLLKSDQLYLMPLAAAVLVILLIFNLRSLAGGLLPVVNAFVATVWTVGIMALLNVPINLLNYILPVLILVIGATEDVHLLHEFREHLREGGDGSSAMRRTASNISLAIFLTGLTTILGFAATSLTELPILRDFGIAAMVAMANRFAITIFLLPAWLRYLGPTMAPHERDGEGEEAGEGQGKGNPFTSQITEGIMTHVLPRPHLVFIALVVFAMPAVFLASNISLSNDLLSFLRKSSPIVTRVNTVAERLAGNKVLYLTLYGNEEDFLTHPSLAMVAALTSYLRALPEVDTVASFSDIVARIHEQLNEGDPAYNRIPERSSAIRQLLLFSHPKDFSAYISPDYATANIVVRCNINDSTELNAFVASIRERLDAGRFGATLYDLTGSSVLVAAAVDAITRTQILSLGSMAIILFIIVSILFVSFRCGLLTLISNLFPITIIFGLMGATGIPLNIGTCMVAAITLGIAIDDTLHLLVRYSRELKIHKDEKKGLRSSLLAEMPPILATSMALAGGFAVLSFSSFEPVRQFGLLSAAVIVLAITADLIITPVLIGSVRLVTLWDLIGFNLRRALLEKSDFFRGFTSWQAKKIILASDIEEYKSGTRVIRRGDIGDKMYVVIAGELEVFLPRGEERISISKMRLGDIFGEIALVSKVRRTADIDAITDTRLLALDTQSLRRLQRFSPFLASHLFYNISQILGKRLAERNRDTSSPLRK